ncbi:ATP-binding protein [Thiocystis violascens]|uniref:histidine kinase n=1 Tax=Thiocystis violascens (strain ATCC 17096 / DSM 198 / 6111) TaxID=765911 RepID=I3YA68_THIV6|nr:ATP-binding protein [Thiocystis violascens]AFL73886.1 signal transduction histidine kinase [Thiocystis violascens DSM 198]
MNGWGARFRERLGVSPELQKNPEFQSATVRITACLFGALYIGLGAWTDYYRVDIPNYLTLFALYLISNLLFLISVARRPVWPARCFLALSLDIIAVSLAIFLTREAISPFYLLYILIFISAGTRFGKLHLIVAAVVAVVAYNFVLIELDEWRRHTFEAAFFLLLLVLLPLYQASLLRQVQQAREDAVRANQAKGDFLAFMTHELRTPLTGVIGMATLLKGTQLDLEQRDYVDSITSSAQALNSLIGDILDFSKIDARKLTLECIPFDPRAMLRNVCEILVGLALSKNLELICQVDPDVPGQATGDPLRVRQILFNLIGNAIKFTEQGQVSLRVGARAPDATLSRPYLLLEIADTGIGIPQDKLPTLFESFRQADDSTTRRFGGSGLGTTIARELTLLMGGTITVESEEGRGSCFRVSLPLLGDGALPSPTPSAARLRGLRVLAIESNPMQRALIGAILEREAAIVRCVAGIQDIDASSPMDTIPGERDIALAILSDVPAVHNLGHALANLRESIGEHPPCLLLSYPGHQLIAPPPGVACLNKPFLAEDLVDAIESLLGRAPADVATRARQDESVSAPSENPPSARPIRVLVAEDNEIAAKVITTFLTKMGFANQRFRDGEAALTAALNGGYQIAIVDFHMPKLDGIGFAKRYRTLAPEYPLPIVALTATAAADVRQACFDAGMDGFLAKPVNPDELRQTVERLALPQPPMAA